MIEFFDYQIDDAHGGGYVRWDVTAAKAAVAAGAVITRSTMALEDMAEIAARNDWDEAVVAKADPAQPGIAAPIIVPGLGVVYTLIDGTHRCVAALRRGQPFVADLLTDEASRRCIVALTDPELVP